VRFEDIINQGKVKQQLTELVNQNRLSHALLFLGNEGSGALALAIAFAQFLVCNKRISSSPADSGKTSDLSLFEAPVTKSAAPDVLMDSCGICPSCQKASQLVHPDIHFSYPTVTKKPGEKPVATDFISDWREFIRLNPYGNLFDWIEQIKEKENSQGKITSRECDEIIKKLSLKSFESGYKVLIMWMPEELEKEGNKLLKIIEEPPPDTLFILVAGNESMVLPTIVSRCQVIRVPALKAGDIESALVKRNNSSSQVAKQVAAVADGDYRRAMQLVQHAEEDWQNLLREWLNAILKTGPLAQAKWVEEISRMGREKQKQFLRYFNHLLEEAIRLRFLNEAVGEKDNTEADFAKRLNKIAGIEQQQAIIGELDKASYFIERNANSKMLFHALTIKLYHIIQDNVLYA
jgi:DNA polymerase III subunit delta'